MTLPRITIITPCRNQSPFIERTICSVLDQGYDNLEYFMVDGASTDGTRELIRHYEGHLAWWSSRPDAGPADAINRALRHATGEIVGVLPGDDVYLPEALHTIAHVMGPADGPAWVVGQGERLGEKDEPIGELNCVAPQSLASYLRHDSGFMPACTTFLRRGTLHEYGRFDHALSLCFEYDYHCRLLGGALRPQEIAASLAGRREHPNQRSSRHVWRQGMEQLEVARRHALNLPIRERFKVWRNCDERERIYALAMTESQGRLARRFLWRQLVRHPWWMAHHAMRHALWRGVEHPAPPAEPLSVRHAA